MKNAIKRVVSEGTVPLVGVEGTAFECGQAYGAIVLRKYPGYTRYLDDVPEWHKKSRLVMSLFEKKAPHILDIFSGLQSVLDKCAKKAGKSKPLNEACTSFSVVSNLTLDKTPISGQNKDTQLESAFQYIVLRMRIKDAPTILVLAYPGELLGYGMWSTGMTIFRNSLHSAPNMSAKLAMVEWGLLALAGSSVDEAQELALKYGILDCGNCLISDSSGGGVSVEFNAGGVNFIRPKQGINTHANHPVGKDIAPFEDYPDKKERENSRHRMDDLWRLLDAERGRITAQKAFMCLADHSRYPRGLCRHKIGERTDMLTTAAVVAEPAKGRLHVVRGTPCANWPATYTF